MNAKTRRPLDKSAVSNLVESFFGKPVYENLIWNRAAQMARSRGLNFERENKQTKGLYILKAREAVREGIVSQLCQFYCPGEKKRVTYYHSEGGKSVSICLSDIIHKLDCEISARPDAFFEKEPVVVRFNDEQADIF